MPLRRTANLLGALSLAVVDRMRQATEDDLGHGGAAPAALTTIGHAPGLSNDLLGQALGLTHSGTVRLVDRLQREGLVERRPGPDQRTIALHLTDSGDRARAQLLRCRAASLAGLVEMLTAAECSTLEAILEKLLVALPKSLPDAYRLCRLCDAPVCENCPMDRPPEA